MDEDVIGKDNDSDNNEQDSNMITKIENITIHNNLNTKNSDFNNKTNLHANIKTLEILTKSKKNTRNCNNNINNNSQLYTNKKSYKNDSKSLIKTNKLNNKNVKNNEVNSNKYTEDNEEEVDLNSDNEFNNNKYHRKLSNYFDYKVGFSNQLADQSNLYDLPCRTEEQIIIENYIKKGLETNGCYNSLYISGMPGTGKTASVIASIKKLYKLSANNQIKLFNSFILNGMKITNNNVLYKQIYNYIFKTCNTVDDKNTTRKNINSARNMNPYKCGKLLDDFFKNRQDYNFNKNLRDERNLHIVLIIDEVDRLVSRKMSLLYNIFNWSLYPNSKLIILSISNTIDLPQRTLNKVSSRMGNNQLTFKPYQREELQKILEQTLISYKLFTKDAIKYCCSKVACISGDIRRIINICKHAEDEWIKRNNDYNYTKEQFIKFNLNNLKKDVPSETNKSSENSNLITLKDVKAASDMLYDDKVKNVICALKLFEKITIIAVSSECDRTESRVDVCSVYNRFKYYALKSKDNNIPSFNEFKTMMYNLERMNILEFNDVGDNFINYLVNIKIYKDELITAFSNDESLKRLMEFKEY